jgi:5'(3')-deoxyribonucleotidase
MTKAIWFDMDGTIADLYGVENWLDYLIAEDTTPYEIAKGMNLAPIAKQLNRLTKQGWTVNIVSWTSKKATPEYEMEIAKTKIEWLDRHLPSVTFTDIQILPYGTPKSTVGNGILFDDEERNRTEWNGTAYDVNNIYEILKGLN